MASVDLETRSREVGPTRPHLLLFTRDLRVVDHPALHAAAARGRVVPLFVLEPTLLRRSSNRTRFLIESLHDLNRSLHELGGRLIVRTGNAATEAASLARETGCDAVYVTADVSPFARKRERRLRRECEAYGVGVVSFPGNAVVAAAAVRPAGGGNHYKVFTPYFRAWDTAPGRPVSGRPRSVILPPHIDPGTLPDAAARPAAADLGPPGGESAGRGVLDRFLEQGLATYGTTRDALADDATSHLSPYLRFGCVSPNELAALTHAAPGGAGFVRQLAWRDFFRQMLAAEPRMLRTSIRDGSAHARAGRRAELDLERWRAGSTGNPLVDAAMHQLAREGWMPNRARLIVASYLTRTLDIDWRHGADHFDRLLVDGDPSSNVGNWQWVAGTAANPKPHRALNPDRQAERFDPDGVYVMRHLTLSPGARSPRRV